MVELSGNAEKIYSSLNAMGAISEEKMKTADDIMKKVSIGKAQINSALKELMEKKMVKRVARQKSAGYFALK